ncbi:MAG: phage minor head protein [Bacteroidota bacterium]
MPDLIPFGLTFSDAILWFRRKLRLPTSRWLDLLGASHDHAFVVAGATKAQLLKDLQEAVDRAISEGTTLADFRKAFDQAVQDAGWTYKGSRGWRTKTIYRTNLRTAHAAGRLRQMQSPEVAERRPYWQYRHGGSVIPREKHINSPARGGWNGLVLRGDDPWWRTHYPPNGWGCSCFVVTLSDADVARLGLEVAEAAPEVETVEHTDTVTGEVRQVPAGIDPGWDYASGASREADRERILEGALRNLPPDLERQARAEITRQLARRPR